METLKIIALTILSELFIYYLITVYLKWNMGFEYRPTRIFNPLVPWIDAIYFEKFSEGCDCCRKKMEEMMLEVTKENPSDHEKNKQKSES
ncbi:hypothetical protein DHW03_15410 [Pedobacter yonginense]|uniref:Uncharacterized protein n=1 Tax=Pedobacter yonginense TaxID=651869 RepID=A0A317EH86_9SPHI|nr:hypothetical protein [Pedobacter yonginense]PWS26181.1 hypothetical protein DHW03_15410 [Pedobacter yonginense]